MGVHVQLRSIAIASLVLAVAGCNVINPDLLGSDGSTGTDHPPSDGGGGTDGSIVGPTDMLILDYEFEDASGTQVTDSAQGLNGTLSDAAMWIPDGRDGYGIAMNGATPASQYVSLPNGVFTDTDDFTISVWVKLNSNPVWARIYDIGNGLPDPANRFMYLTTNGFTTDGVNDGIHASSYGGSAANESVVDTFTSLPLGVWKHIALTGSGGQRRLYIDGFPAMTLQDGPAVAPREMEPISPSSWLGKSRFAADPGFPGVMDEFRVYNRVLTSSEIAALAWPKSDYAYWRFDDSSGSAAKESSDHGYATALANGASWTTGRMGGAVAFAGGDGAASGPHVVITGDPLSGCTNQFTIAAWMRIDEYAAKSRLFDFGKGTAYSIYLSPFDGTGMHVGMKAPSGTVRHGHGGAAGPGRQHLAPGDGDDGQRQRRGAVRGRDGDQDPGQQRGTGLGLRRPGRGVPGQVARERSLLPWRHRRAAHRLPGVHARRDQEPVAAVRYLSTLLAGGALVIAACGHPRAVPADAAQPDGAGAGASVDAAARPDARAGGPASLDLSGAIAPVHDPSIIAVDGTYYVFSTGTGLPIRSSTDLVNWSLSGQVFESKPAWVTTTDPNAPNTLWAPDISYFGGQYHLYYAASTFGSNDSCIGHATTDDIASRTWVDHGAVICSSADDDWNAIDPAAVVDGQGQVWLALGSFWSGLKLIQLDDQGARLGTSFYSLATRDNTAVEASFIVPHDGFYYLFESVDFCCQGTASTYKIMVGRAADIQGPYVDEDGTALLSGGGTLLVEGDARWRGPGHNAVLHTPTGDYNVYHSYDAQAAGIPTLRISDLEWSATDGWPVSAGP